ncbi:hypothetical protein DFH09DRAFT_1087479 [Mycena vulgaris]|nr:hypothetical protein DFH09DRAFT_1087479 [Mycena vulgaris]
MRNGAHDPGPGEAANLGGRKSSQLDGCCNGHPCHALAPVVVLSVLTAKERPQAQRTPLPYQDHLHRCPRALQLWLRIPCSHAAPLHPTPLSPAHGASSAREGGRRDEYRGHQYSRSLSASKDMYTDLLPSAGSSSGEHQQWRGVQGPHGLPVPPGLSNNSLAGACLPNEGGYIIR